MSKFQQYVLFMVGLAIVYLLSIFMFTGIPIKITPQDAFTKQESVQVYQGINKYLMRMNQRLEVVEGRLKINTPTPIKEGNK